MSSRCWSSLQFPTQIQRKPRCIQSGREETVKHVGLGTTTRCRRSGQKVKREDAAKIQEGAGKAPACSGTFPRCFPCSCLQHQPAAGTDGRAAGGSSSHGHVRWFSRSPRAAGAAAASAACPTRWVRRARRGSCLGLSPVTRVRSEVHSTRRQARGRMVAPRKQKPGGCSAVPDRLVRQQTRVVHAYALLRDIYGLACRLPAAGLWLKVWMSG